MKNIAYAVCVLMSLVACGNSKNNAAAVPVSEHNAQSEAQKLNQIVDDYFERTLELNPVFATSIGDLRYNDRFPNTLGKQWIADALAVEQDHLDRLQKVDASLLDDAARLTYDIFKYQRELNIEGAQFRDELLPISQFDSLPVQFGLLGSGKSVQPFTSVKQYDDFLKRIDGFVIWIDQAIKNMQAGIDAGIVHPKPLIEKALPQLQSFIVSDPKQSLFYQPIVNFPDAISADDRKRLAAAYEKAIRDSIVPSYRRLYEFMKNDYLPKARTSVG